MQEYYIAFVKSGPDRPQTKEVADSLANLDPMVKAGDWS